MFIVIIFKSSFLCWLLFRSCPLSRTFCDAHTTAISSLSTVSRTGLRTTRSAKTERALAATTAGEAVWHERESVKVYTLARERPFRPPTPHGHAAHRTPRGPETNLRPFATESDDRLRIFAKFMERTHRAATPLTSWKTATSWWIQPSCLERQHHPCIRFPVRDSGMATLHPLYFLRLFTSYLPQNFSYAVLSILIDMAPVVRSLVNQAMIEKASPMFVLRVASCCTCNSMEHLTTKWRHFACVCLSSGLS